MRHHYYTTEIEPIFKGPTNILVKYLFAQGILKEHTLCKSCSKPMPIKPYTRNKDDVAFRCMQKDCKNYMKYISIRVGSIFENYRFHLKVGIQLLWKWSIDAKDIDTKKEIRVDKKVLIDFYDDLRKCCVTFFKLNPCKLGGNGIICQIDESLFRHKPKHHRGRATDREIWVFGIADTSNKPSKIYLEVVEDRSASTLLPIVERICRNRTIIISDKWKAYNKIEKELGFRHLQVNHSLHFVDPNTQAHTQAIESYWAKVKYRIKIKKGILGNKMDLYLNEWMWKDNIFNGDWVNLLNLIKLYNK